MFPFYNSLFKTTGNDKKVTRVIMVILTTKTNKTSTTMLINRLLISLLLNQLQDTTAVMNTATRPLPHKDLLRANNPYYTNQSTRFDPLPFILFQQPSISLFTVILDNPVTTSLGVTLIQTLLYLFKPSLIIY